MQIPYALAALPLLVAAAPPTVPTLRAEACRGPATAATAGAPARPRRLGELPPGRPWRAVYRLEAGCPTPVALPTSAAGRR